MIHDTTISQVWRDLLGFRDIRKRIARTIVSGSASFQNRRLHLAFIIPEYRTSNKVNANGSDFIHGKQSSKRGYHSYYGSTSIYGPRGARPPFATPGYAESPRGRPQQQASGLKEEVTPSHQRWSSERPRNAQRSRSVPATSRVHVVDDHTTDDEGGQSPDRGRGAPTFDADQRRGRPRRDGPVIYEREGTTPPLPHSPEARPATRGADSESGSTYLLMY